MRRTIFIGEGEVDGKSSFRSSPKAPVQNMPQVNKRTCRQQKLQGLFHSNKIKIRCVYTGYLEVLIEISIRAVKQTPFLHWFNCRI